MLASSHISGTSGLNARHGQIRAFGDLQPVWALGKVLIAMQGLTFEERQLVLVRAKVLVDGSKRDSVERSKSRRRGDQR